MTYPLIHLGTVFGGTPLPQYRFQNKQNQTGISLAEQWEMSKINSLLDRYVGDPSPQEIIIVLVVEDSDLSNMRAIKDNIDTLRKEASMWESGINCLTDEQIEAIAEVGRFEYRFQNNQPVTPSNQAAAQYLEYLQSFFKIARLADKINEMTLRSPIFFFSSDRRSDANLQAATSQFGENEYYGQYQSVYNAATGGATNLMQFSTRHFGRLKWRAMLRASASNEQAESFFEEEADVKLVRKYLGKLGYEWRLMPVDRDHMNYRMEFYKDGQYLEPTKFSSGEREIFHFLFAAFALNVEDGVIIIDEPELHLHPRWQRIFLDLFYDLSQERKNQFILATHSPVFVTPRTIENITRVYQTDRKSQRASLADAQLPNRHHLVRIVNSHNNERLFFADEVVLVEGISDRLILSSLIQFYSSQLAINRTIEVIEVGGKNNFTGYKELCDGLLMPVSIVADRDYLQEIGSDDVKELFVTDYGKVWDNLRKKKSNDRRTLCRILEQSIKDGNLEDLQKFWGYLKTRGTALKENLSDEENSRIDVEISNHSCNNIYILRHGEIEDYLPQGYSDVTGIVDLVQEPSWLRIKIDKSRALELNEIICRILGVDEEVKGRFSELIVGTS